jgi:hypothetical protein
MMGGERDSDRYSGYKRHSMDHHADYDYHAPMSFSKPTKKPRTLDDIVAKNSETLRSNPGVLDKFWDEFVSDGKINT